MSDNRKVPSAGEFLATVKEFSADQGGSKTAGELPPRLGTVDAGYGGSGAALVQFDGETTTGTRAYIPLQPVYPGDRVVLLPVGHTYVIAGALGVAGTGWTALAPGPGIASTPVVRREGNAVFSRGSFQFAAGGTITSAFVTLGTLPVAPINFAPAAQYLVGIGTSFAAIFQGIILPTGEVQIRTFQAGGVAYSTNSSFSITTPWLLG